MKRGGVGSQVHLCYTVLSVVVVVFKSESSSSLETGWRPGDDGSGV